MKQQIKIDEINVKESQAGTEFASVKYLPYGRSSLVGKGTEVATCWDRDIYNKLNKDKKYTVGITTSKDGKFKNIRELYDGSDIPNVEEVFGKGVELVKEEDVKADKFADARAEKNKCIYTAYAKDIFIALLEAEEKKQPDERERMKFLMDRAVSLVKQAEGGF
jgi:hypothetical protein